MTDGTTLASVSRSVEMGCKSWKFSPLPSASEPDTDDRATARSSTSCARTSTCMSPSSATIEVPTTVAVDVVHSSTWMVSNSVLLRHSLIQTETTAENAHRINNNQKDKITKKHTNTEENRETKVHTETQTSQHPHQHEHATPDTFTPVDMVKHGSPF